MYAFYPRVMSFIVDTPQRDYVGNHTHPAQYWSGQSQNGTVFMLVGTFFMF